MSASREGLAARLPAAILTLVVCGLVAASWMGGAASRRHLVALLVLTFLGAWLVVFAWSRASRAERAARFVVVLAGLGLAAGLVEALALAGAIDAPALFGVHSRLLWLQPGNRFDPELLWRRDPHSTVSVTRARGNLARALNLPATGPVRRYEARYDGNGFRNPSDLRSAAVVVVGDSYVEGAELPVEQTFPALLSRATGDTVANLGLGGYGPQQALAALRLHGLPLGPRAAVWCFYEGNDLGDALRYEAWRAQLDRGLRRSRGVSERMVLPNAIDALQRLTVRRDTSLVAGRSGTFAGMRIQFGDPCDRLGVHERDGLAIVERCLDQADSLARHAGSRLLLVFVPNKFRVLRGHVRLPHHSECLDWACNDLPERLQAMMAARGHGGDFLDLTAALTAPLDEGSLTYLPDDTHWTPLGHEIVAREVARWLAAPP